MQVMRIILFAMAAALLGWGAGGWVLSLGYGGCPGFLMLIFCAPHLIVFLMRRGGVLCGFIFNIATLVSIIIRNYWLDSRSQRDPLEELNHEWHMWLMLFLFTCSGAALAWLAKRLRKEANAAAQ